MRILFIISSLYSGGAEKVASLLCNKWVDTNEVHILLTSIRSNKTYHLNEHINIHYCSENKTMSPLKKGVTCTKIAKKIGPDIIISFVDPCQYYASVAAKRLKIPLICSERNSPAHETNMIRRLLRFIAYKRANAIVFQTNEARDYFPKSIRKKGSIILNPIDTFCLPSYENEKEDCIVTSGRLVEQKNYIMLLDAFKIFSSTHNSFSLKIFGQGPDKAKLLDYCKKQNIPNVHFCGFSNDIKKDISTAKIFASSSNHEGIPNSMIDALLIGIPCVYTDCPVGGSKILNSFGENVLNISVPVGDYVAMANAFSSILDDYSNRLSDSKRYIKILTNELNVDTISKKWLDLMNNVLEGI